MLNSDRLNLTHHSDHMEQLNKEQQQAVAHIEGPLLVLAGAGSGKTRVVTNRIAYLLEIGIPASEILAVTFTNKAAEVMKSRIEAKSHQRVLCATFHSLGARILRESAPLIGYKREFTIYDEDDSLKVIKSCLNDLNEKGDSEQVKKMRQSISYHKNQLILPNETSDNGLEDKLLAKLFPMYQRRMKSYQAVDFDDLLFLPVQILKQDEQIQKMYQDRWPFLLIDEYQDTNPAQCQLTKLLAGTRQNVFAVGDPDQSIYSWRGANYQNILRFSTDFVGAKIVYLEQNYRSTKTILEASNAVIAKNLDRYPKALWSDLDVGEKISLVTRPNEREEAAFIVDQIQLLTKTKGIPLKEIAIFYRTNSQSRSLEDRLLEKRVPHQIIGGLSFYQRKEIKDLLALLKMLLSDEDSIALFRTINLPKRGIGQKTLEKISSLAHQHNLPLFTLCKRLGFGEVVGDFSLTQKQKNAFQEYVQGILSLRKLVLQKEPLHEIISKTISTMNYLEALKEDPETYDERRENVESLIGKGAEESEKSLVTFLEELTLKGATDGMGYEDAVRLMTIHNSKGLEFTLVFIAGMEEDLFPHFNAKDDPGSLEEERRLFYVGMTRAKELLYLTRAELRYVFGAPKFMRPSRFLKEIPVKYLKNPSSQATLCSDEEEDELTEGDEIFHQNFGKGWIRRIYSTSLGMTYDVEFEGEETLRCLIAKYAKLVRSNRQ